MNSRFICVQVLKKVVLQGHSLPDAFAAVFLKTEKSQQPFIQAICYGVCRYYFRLRRIAISLLEKPLKEKDKDIFLLILIGLYQLTDMAVAAHAAVNETVLATKPLKKIWAKNFVNAILRNYQRRSAEIQKNLQEDPDFLFSHPTWLREKIQQAWPEQSTAILMANNQQAPLVLRVNLQKNSREHYLQRLQEKSITAQIIPETTGGIVLTVALDVHELPGFYAGDVSVQDGAAQMAASLINPQKGEHILDACAAPGGKTAHLLELQTDIKLTAVDRDESRLQLVKENLQRLELPAIECHAKDAANLTEWWDGKKFDKILLDVPCSASGVIRRHPDIKLLRRAEDILALVTMQKKLLQTVWQTLKPGGLLLYSTCSIFPDENCEVLSDFFEYHADCKEEKIAVDWGMDCPIGKQILPGMHGMDGFYYAILRKC
ncbi:hypothetical protein AYO45_03810 [Gammaproteobacteria bacterium SCGC AG-212-F23]|nr:hypothetical protein AYO45_03810 [Gammaproteobacteria bacterium SCGC AG-212-F23]